MKAVVWRRGVTKYVIPHLPGDWKVAKAILYREPADWLLCYVSMETSRWSSAYRVAAIVQLLAVRKEYQTGLMMQDLRDATGRGLWQSAANLTEVEPAMREILDLIQTEALPIFDRVGNIAGYARLAEERARQQPMDVHFQHNVFCLRLLQGDVEGALSTAEAVHRAAHADGADWALGIDTNVAGIAQAAQRNPDEAIEMLRSNAAYTRTHLGLPPTATDQAP